MAVIVGQARHDELGNINGGAVGDQLQKSNTNDTVGEVSMQNFYVHTKGWYILRAKDDAIAEKLASAMRDACNNPNIGYDQSGRYGVINQMGKVGKLRAIVTKTEADCQSLVRACCIEAGFDPGDFNTSNEAFVLVASGKFKEKIGYTSNTKLYNGDVLVTKTKGHTVIVVSGEPREVVAGVNPTTTNPTTVSGNKYVVEFQKWLNANYNVGLALDGSCGPATTKAAIKAMQSYLRVNVNSTLAIDGSWGPASMAACGKINLKVGSRGTAVYILQGMLYGRGYDPNGLDSSYGEGCAAAVGKFQKDKNLTYDKQAGPQVFTALFK